MTKKKRYLKEWYKALRSKLKQYVEKLNNKIEKIGENEIQVIAPEDRFMNLFLVCLPEYVHRLKEVGGWEDGIKISVSLPFPKNVNSIEKEKKYRIADAVQRYWNKASIAYVWGDFRGCILYSASIVKGGLKLKVYDKKLGEELKSAFQGERFTLKQLLRFCEEKKVINEKIKQQSEAVNKISSEHIQSLSEEKVETISQITEKDEFRPLESFQKKPPIQIEGGRIEGDIYNFIVDSIQRTPGILYKYKKDAENCLKNARQVLKELY